MAFRKQLEQGNALFTSEDFVCICKELKDKFLSDSGVEIKWDVQSEHELSINVHEDITKYLINQLLWNAIESSKRLNETEKEFLVTWMAGEDKSKVGEYSASITVWNAGTNIHPDVLLNAGRTPAKNVDAGHTGLGFYFIELMLEQLKAIKKQDGRHFSIENIVKPVGVKVSFAFSAQKKDM
jgi:hypothetical protein